jgi:hypothetical protein
MIPSTRHRRPRCDRRPIDAGRPRAGPQPPCAERAGVAPNPRPGSAPQAISRRRELCESVEKIGSGARERAPSWSTVAMPEASSTSRWRSAEPPRMDERESDGRALRSGAVGVRIGAHARASRTSRCRRINSRTHGGIVVARVAAARPRLRMSEPRFLVGYEGGEQRNAATGARGSGAHHRRAPRLLGGERESSSPPSETPAMNTRSCRERSARRSAVRRRATRRAKWASCARVSLWPGNAGPTPGSPPATAPGQRAHSYGVPVARADTAAARAPAGRRRDVDAGIPRGAGLGLPAPAASYSDAAGLLGSPHHVAQRRPSASPPACNRVLGAHVDATRPSRTRFTPMRP